MNQNLKKIVMSSEIDWVTFIYFYSPDTNRVSKVINYFSRFDKIGLLDFNN